jgi:hypothetical protein
MVKDIHLVNEALPVEILVKIGPLPTKVERLRRLLTGWTRGVGRGRSYEAVYIECIGVVYIIKGHR